MALRPGCIAASLPRIGWRMQHSAFKPVRDPGVHATVTGEGARAIELSGAWDIRALESRARTLQTTLEDAARGGDASWNLSQVERLDHIGALLLWRAWGKRRPAALQVRREHELFFTDLDVPGETAHRDRSAGWLGPVLVVGSLALTVVEHTLAIIRLFGQLLIDALAVLKHPPLRPWREFSAGIYTIGAQALGITAMVGFLIGVVLSYLSAEQLRLVGADTLIINILGIGIIRELGPMVCSVLVAGRSGSAITAQLGVMRVTEELDALSVMGISHTLRLILPKVAALAVVLPLLVLWTSGVALLGGAVSAKIELGLSIGQFLAGLPAAVPDVNLWLGIGKGVVFGVLIALIACHFGLRVQPNTASLAAGTTRSVVTSITAVIVADAIFAVIFSDVGWS